MFRKIQISIIVAVLTFTFIGTSLALEPGNDRKGKYLYRKVYKNCMARGEVDSPRPVLNPDAKTQAQWTRVFEKKQFDQFGCKQEWDNLTDEELADIYAYLHKHAADSPTPAKCK